MDKTKDNSKNKPLVIILFGIAIAVVGIIAFVLAYSHFSGNNDTKHISTIASKVYTNGDDFISHIEDTIGFEFPSDCTTYNESKNYDSFSVEINEYHDTVDYFAVVYCDNKSESELEKIEKQLNNDERFKSSLGDMKKIVDVNGGEVLDEYKLVYVMDTEEFNTLPQRAGEYRLITVWYDADLHTFLVEEYNNNYYKTEYPTQ